MQEKSMSKQLQMLCVVLLAGIFIIQIVGLFLQNKPNTKSEKQTQIKKQANFAIGNKNSFQPNTARAEINCTAALIGHSMLGGYVDEYGSDDWSDAMQELLYSGATECFEVQTNDTPLFELN